MEQSKAEFLKKAADLYDEVSIIDEMLDAIVRRDEAEMRRIMPKVQFEAGVLQAYKSNLGADFIREWKMDTTLADKELGPDWLDREDC